MATDLAIYSLNAFPHIQKEQHHHVYTNNTTVTSNINNNNNNNNTNQHFGISIATCCHHACVFNDYIGSTYNRYNILYISIYNHLCIVYN